MKFFYALLCVVGTVLPYYQFIPWLIDNGLDVALLYRQASSLRIGAFAWLDVLVSAVALLGFILREGRQLRIPTLWLPIVGTFIVGVSSGLPLFLLLREIHSEQPNARQEILR